MSECSVNLSGSHLIYCKHVETQKNVSLMPKEKLFVVFSVAHSAVGLCTNQPLFLAVYVVSVIQIILSEYSRNIHLKVN